MKGCFQWPIDVRLLAVAAILLVAVLLGGCQVTLHGVDGRALAQVTVDPEAGLAPDVKSGSSSSSGMQLQ